MMSLEQKHLATDALCEVAEAMRLAVGAAKALDSARSKMDAVIAGMSPTEEETKRAERFSLAVTRASLMMNETVRVLPDSVQAFGAIGRHAAEQGVVGRLAQLTQEIVAGVAVPA